MGADVIAERRHGNVSRGPLSHLSQPFSVSVSVCGDSLLSYGNFERVRQAIMRDFSSLQTRCFFLQVLPVACISFPHV